MVASGDGHTNIVQLLLEHGANANLQNKVSSSAKTVLECLPYCCAPGIQLNTPSCLFGCMYMCGPAVVKCVMSHVCLSMSAWH